MKKGCEIKMNTRNKNAIRLCKDDQALNVVIILITLFIIFIMVYPMYFTVIASLSDAYEVVRGNVFLLPKGFNLDAYKAIFANTKIWTGYLNTIKYTVGGTILSLVLTIPCAYALSKKRLIGHSLLSIYFLIPMYFSGGMVPTYLQVKNLELLNRSFTLIVLSCVSIYNLIVTRVYFQTSIPEELYESARIDGSGEARTFLTIAMPLAKPIVAVMALFYAVAKWNDYFLALIYVNRQSLQPLQSVLRNILLLSQSALSNIDYTNMTPEEIEALNKLAYLSETLKYALIFVASAPLLIAYPFVQKHFVKGMMIGALKG